MVQSISRVSIFVLCALVALSASWLPASGQELKRRAILGVAATSVPADVRAANKLGENEGVLATRVFPGAAGAEAGVQAGDVIVAINGRPTGSPQEFTAAARALKAGERVEFSIVRGGERRPLAVTAREVVETPGDFDVLYRSVDVDGARRRVVVTKPKGEGRRPAVMLVGGIGCYSLDNPFAEDDAYRRVLYNLTRNGYVTMRVEKSGMGDSEGPPCQTVDLTTEVKGYVAGLRALKGYDFVDPRNVFIFGHSIGGVSGPLAAIEEPVKGLAVAATTSVNWVEYELENTRRQLRLGGAEPEAVEAQMKVKERCMHAMLVEKRSPEEVVKAAPDCQPFVGYPAHHTYVQQLADQNLPGLWKKLDAHVLVIDAGADFVTSRREHDYLVEVVNHYHPGKGTLVRIPDMDHYLNVSASERDSFASLSQQGAEARFNERINEELVKWLKARA